MHENSYWWVYIHKNRYTDKYLFQLAIIPGKIVDLDSFLLPIVDELNSLGKYGMVVKKFDGEIIKSKVHLMLASGDIPQVRKKNVKEGHKFNPYLHIK